ncbi:MAG: polyhydroxyalkanoate synthesis repressor PhaR [Pseudomonadota bacterium]
MTHHLIKKYPNRRLYDTQASKYITLTSLKNLITSGACIKIIDTATDEDITRSVLLQIIIEAEASGEPMFSAETLQQIIRFYGGTLQGMFAKYIEESLQLFTQQQKQMNSDPLTAMTRMAEQNMATWANLFDVSKTSDPKDSSKK